MTQTRTPAPARIGLLELLREHRCAVEVRLWTAQRATEEPARLEDFTEASFPGYFRPSLLESNDAVYGDNPPWWQAPVQLHWTLSGGDPPPPIQGYLLVSYHDDGTVRLLGFEELQQPAILVQTNDTLRIDMELTVQRTPEGDDFDLLTVVQTSIVWTMKTGIINFTGRDRQNLREALDAINRLLDRDAQLDKQTKRSTKSELPVFPAADGPLTAAVQAVQARLQFCLQL